MKLECSRERLRTVISLAERVTGKGLALPQLAQVYLAATDRFLVVRSTNLDLGVEWRLPARVDKTGAALVPGVVLANFLANLTGDEKIKLELVNQNLSLETDQHHTLIKTQSADDFPSLPEIKQGQKLKLAATELLAGLKMVAYAAALNDIKPEIASVYLHTNDQQLILVATDSFRLAEKKLKLATTIPNLKLIIPIRNITEIIRLLEQLNGEVTLIYDRHQLAFQSDQVYLTSRLIDGVFPDYQQLIPAKALTQVSVDKIELASALKVANIFTDRLNHVSFKIRPEDQLLEIESQSGEVGENTSLLPAAVTGEPLVINFNLRYLLDGLQSVVNTKLSLQFNGRTKPILLAGVGDDNFNYLIMPLNR